MDHRLHCVQPDGADRRTPPPRTHVHLHHQAPQRGYVRGTRLVGVIPFVQIVEQGDIGRHGETRGEASRCVS